MFASSAPFGQSPPWWLELSPWRRKPSWLDSALLDPTVSGQTWSSLPEVFSFFELSHSVLAQKVFENFVSTRRSVPDAGEDLLRQFYFNVFVRGSHKFFTHLLWAHLSPLCDGYTGVFRQFPGHSSLQIRAGEWVWNVYPQSQFTGFVLPLSAPYVRRYCEGCFEIPEHSKCLQIGNCLNKWWYLLPQSERLYSCGKELGSRLCIDTEWSPIGWKNKIAIFKRRILVILKGHGTWEVLGWLKHSQLNCPAARIQLPPSCPSGSRFYFCLFVCLFPFSLCVMNHPQT